MTQRLALTISAAVTAFVLVLVGGIAARASVSQRAAADVPPPAPASSAAAAPAPHYAISPQEAAQIALRVAPGTQLTSNPDLVRFQGAVAYEVTLDRGQVYVDANTGQVLYNGAPAILASAGPTLSTGTTRKHEAEHEAHGEKHDTKQGEKHDD